MSKVTVDVKCWCGATEDWGKYVPAHGLRSGLWSDLRGNEGTVDWLIKNWLETHTHNKFSTPTTDTTLKEGNHE